MTDAPPADSSPGHLVVIGASAGGIEALSILVNTLEPGFPAPIVVVQHLDPRRPSHLGEILARRTKLPVVTVADRAPLTAGTIHVIPANQQVTVTDHEVSLGSPPPDGRPVPSVDHVLSTAAEQFGEGLIAVILTGTGTGSDGADGARIVKRHGGTVVIQDPETVQAATEEVETLNEELQATNEELETLNEELQATVEELNTTNDDMQARAVELQEVTVDLEEQRRTAETDRARLATLIESMRDGVLVVDGGGRTVLRNSAFVRLLERDLAGAGGDEPSPFDLDVIRGRVAAGEEFVLPFVVAGRDGHRRWYEAYARPVPDEMGIGGGGILVVHDTSDVSLRRLQQEFVGIVAHELRTPLTALRGYLQMLSRGGDGQDRLVPLAVDQAERLNRMVDELFDVTRVERGRLRIERSSEPLGEIVAATIEIAEGLSDRHHIRFEPPVTEITAEVDRGRIQQVVLNLLMNAIVHAPASPEIDVRLRRLRGRAEIEVEDHGPGISPEDQANLFEPFEQASASRPIVGLGLGLYIARQIVTAHGGSIDVDSALGEGTTFTVRLPLVAPPRSEAPDDGQGADGEQAAARPGSTRARSAPRASSAPSAARKGRAKEPATDDDGTGPGATPQTPKAKQGRGAKG